MPIKLSNFCSRRLASKLNLSHFGIMRSQVNHMQGGYIKRGYGAIDQVGIFSFGYFLDKPCKHFF